MRYTPIATDAHGGLCSMPARAPHVTEKGYTALFIDSPGRTGGQKPGFFTERRVTDRRTRQKTGL